MSVGGACGVIVGYFIEVVDSQIQRATLAAKGNVFKEQEIKDDISANRLLRQRSALWWNLAHLIVTIIIGMVLFNAFGRHTDPGRLGRLVLRCGADRPGPVLHLRDRGWAGPRVLLHDDRAADARKVGRFGTVL